MSRSRDDILKSAAEQVTRAREVTEKYKLKESYDIAGPNSSTYHIFSRIPPILLGLIIATKTTASVAVPSATPLIGSILIGLPITVWPWSFVAKGLRELLIYQPDFVRGLSMFAFHFSMMILSAFIGLAILSSFISLAFNPFLIPSLITVGIASGIVLAATVMVASRLRYAKANIEDDEKPTSWMKSAGGKLLAVFNPFSTNARPFNHHQTEANDKLNEGCWVIKPLNQKLKFPSSLTGHAHGLFTKEAFPDSTSSPAARAKI